MSSFQRSTGSIGFATVSLPIDDMEALGSTFGASDFRPPRNSVIVTPNPAAMTRLQKIHAVAGELAEHAPDVIAVPEAARALEQALLSALADCLITPDRKGRRTGSLRRNVIMNRFYAVLEAHPDGDYPHPRYVQGDRRLESYADHVLQRDAGDESRIGI